MTTELSEEIVVYANREYPKYLLEVLCQGLLEPAARFCLDTAFHGNEVEL